MTDKPKSDAKTLIIIGAAVIALGIFLGASNNDDSPDHCTTTDVQTGTC